MRISFVIFPCLAYHLCSSCPYQEVLQSYRAESTNLLQNLPPVLVFLCANCHDSDLHGPSSALILTGEHCVLALPDTAFMCAGGRQVMLPSPGQVSHLGRFIGLAQI